MGKTSSSSLRKAPFFFLLASDLGNFRSVERHSQTELDHRPAICQACLRKIPVCHGGKKASFSSEILWIKQNPTYLLLACKCDIWSKWNTCRQLNSKPIHLNFCYLWNFLIWSAAAPLDIKPHPKLWKWQLAPTAKWCCLCGIAVIYSSQREWLNGFVFSLKKLQSCIVWNLQAQMIIFLEEILKGGSLEIASRGW